MRFLLLFLIVAGCQAPRGIQHPYLPVEERLKNTVAAERLTKQAADLIPLNPDQAEKLLRDALVQDLFFGPAHNNLGVVFLGREMYYEAAGEFEWAKKLMPGHPDPKVNLALTLERAGRADDAVTEYTAALEVYPGYLPAIQGLARAAVVRSGEDARLDAWLERIAMEGESDEWREWARERLMQE